MAETMSIEDTCAAMQRLRGQIATPTHLLSEARELEERGFMKFHEWPSGHWGITERGRNFIEESSNA